MYIINLNLEKEFEMYLFEHLYFPKSEVHETYS